MNLVILIFVVINNIKVLVLLLLCWFQWLLLFLLRLLLPLHLHWHSSILLLNGLASALINWSVAYNFSCIWLLRRLVLISFLLIKNKEQEPNPLVRYFNLFTLLNYSFKVRQQFLLSPWTNLSFILVLQLFKSFIDVTKAEFYQIIFYQLKDSNGSLKEKFGACRPDVIPYSYAQTQRKAV